MSNLQDLRPISGSSRSNGKNKKRKVHLIDDNSSTGQTVELAARLLRTQFPSEIKIIVAEADLVRSQLSIDSPDRKFIADTSVYAESISVLPVSRKILPKHDIKEIVERRKMIASVKRRYFGESVPAYKPIIGRAYLSLFDALSRPARRPVSDREGVFGFRGTFLSNFFPASVECNGVNYQSVEHAYQAMKFSHVSRVEVSEQDLRKINRVLARRGEQVSHYGVTDLFNSGLTPGSSKIVGNHLRRLGYVRKDWDYVKVDVMTLLLCQKFANEELHELLMGTGDLYLEESNDWGDTFWGVCENRGRNMLGHLLFHLRAYELKDLRSLAVASTAELLSLARMPLHPVSVPASLLKPVPPSG